MSLASWVAARPIITQLPPSSFLPRRTDSADSFVDSMGINIHLHNDNTLYGDFPLIYRALVDLGLRHTRDGLINTTWNEYYKRHAQLAAVGIHCIFITSPEDTETQLLNFKQNVRGAVEGLEFPNEYDRTGGARWASNLAAYAPRLFKIAHGFDQTTPIMVVGPSLTRNDSFAELPPLQEDFDIINMHNYFGGWNPGNSGWGDNGYGSILWNLAIAYRGWGIKPVFTTETGYLTDMAVPQAIGEQIQAVYIPRIFLEQRLANIGRTYLYELADGNLVIPKGERSYGLLRADGSRKPAFIALQRLIAALSDPGPAFSPKPLDADLRLPSPYIHYLLLQKRSGIFYLAFWLEEPSFDQNSREPLTVAPVGFTLSCFQAIQVTRLLTLDPAAQQELSPPGDGKTVNLTATVAVRLLEFRLATS